MTSGIPLISNFHPSKYLPITYLYVKVNNKKGAFSPLVSVFDVDRRACIAFIPRMQGMGKLVKLSVSVDARMSIIEYEHLRDGV